MADGMTNKKFAAEDNHFKKCCEAAGIPATPRQAGKFKRKAGRAYKDGLLEVKRQQREAKNGIND